MDYIVDWLSSWNVGGKTSIIWFILLAICLVFTSKGVVKNLDVIQSKTKINGSFIGGAVLAGVSSMPELITEIIQSNSGKPEIGIADDVGSNVFSIFLIGVTALIYLKKLFLGNCSKFVKISLWTSFFVMALFTTLLYVGKDVVIGVEGKFAIGIIPFLFFVFYLFTLYFEYKFGKDEDGEGATSEIFIKKTSVKKAFLLFLFWATLLVVSALGLNWSADSMGNGFGLKGNLVGGFFLSITTSLPEIIVFLILMKQGKTSGAILTLVGSHIFNIGISFFGDLAYSQGPTFNNPEVSSNWELGALGTGMILLLAIQVMIGKYLTKKRYYIIIPIVVTITYLVGLSLIAIYT